MSRRVLLFLGLALALGVPNVLIARKERLLRSGTTMLLELAPVDPRSLIEGDYMLLDYWIARSLPHVSRSSDDAADDGHLVVALDEREVAQFVRRHAPGVPLAAGEHLLRYRQRKRRVRVGTDAYYFQEGRAELFARARYGEFRVSPDGECVLVGLRDAERRPIAPNAPAGYSPAPSSPGQPSRGP